MITMDVFNKIRDLWSANTNVDISTSEINRAWQTTLQKSQLFKDLSLNQLQQLAPLFEEVHCEPGTTIIQEGEKSRDIYIIHQGRVEVVKAVEQHQLSYVMATLEQGACFGEMALLDDNEPRSATIRTAEAAVLLKIPANMLDQLAAEESSAYTKLVTSLARSLADRVRNTNALTIESLKKELVLTKSRVAAGTFIIYTFMLLALYIISVNILAELAHNMATTTFLTTPLLFIYSIGFYMMMKHSGYPLSFYGFNLNNWRLNLAETLIWTIGFCLIITFLKWLLIKFVPFFQGIPLLDVMASINPNFSAAANIQVMALTIFAYSIAAPLQEIIFRGAIQSLLQDFLTGKYHLFWAIVLSSTFFSIGHLHVSIYFTLLVFIPSVFWGIMYARQKSLLGVCISHVLVGCWVLFGLGFIRFIRLLMGTG